MKKFLTLAILSLSSLAFASSAEAKSSDSANALTVAANNAVAPQYQRRVRVVTTTRNVRRGRFLYRETYRTRYQPNGRVVQRLISRVVIRRY